MRAAIELPQEQRRAAFTVIKDKAAAGGYGEAAQDHAEQLHRFLQRRG